MGYYVEKTLYIVVDIGNYHVRLWNQIFTCLIIAFPSPLSSRLDLAGTASRFDL